MIQLPIYRSKYTKNPVTLLKQRKRPISRLIFSLLVCNGKQVSKNWIDNTRQFARQMNAQTLYLKCVHYVHHYESKAISREIESFISRISKRAGTTPVR